MGFADVYEARKKAITEKKNESSSFGAAYEARKAEEQKSGVEVLRHTPASNWQYGEAPREDNDPLVQAARDMAAEETGNNGWEIVGNNQRDMWWTQLAVDSAANAAERNAERQQKSAQRLNDNMRIVQEQARPEQYTADNITQYAERARALSELPEWTEEQQAEAQEIYDLLKPSSSSLLTDPRGWWNNTMYALTKNGEKYTPTLAARTALGGDLYDQLGGVADNLEGRLHKGKTAFMSGFLSGTGATSATKALTQGLDSLGVDMVSAWDTLDQLGMYNDFSANAAPTAYAAGNIAGNVALYTGISKAVTGAIGAVPSASAIPTSLVPASAAGAGASTGATVAANGFKVLLDQVIRRSASAALSYAASDAIRNVGNLATGEMSSDKFVKELGKSGLTGIATGLASSLVSAGATGIINKYKLTSPLAFFAKEMLTGLTGAGAYTGVDLAFTTKPMSEDEYVDIYTMYFENATLEQARNAYNNYIDDYHAQIRKSAGQRIMIGFLTTLVQSAISTAQVSAANKQYYNSIKRAIEDEAGRVSQTLYGGPDSQGINDPAARERYVADVTANIENIQRQIEEGFTNQQDFTNAVGEKAALADIWKYLEAFKEYINTPTSTPEDIPMYEENFGFDVEALANAFSSAFSYPNMTPAEAAVADTVAPAPAVPDVGAVAGAAAAAPVTPVTPPVATSPVQEPTQDVEDVLSAAAQEAAKGTDTTEPNQPAETQEKPPVEAAPEPPAVNDPEMIRNQLTEAAGNVGIGDAALEHLTQFAPENISDVADYFGEFAKYYAAGQNGTPIEDVPASETTAISPQVRRIAYNDGQMAAIHSTAKPEPVAETPAPDTGKPVAPVSTGSISEISKAAQKFFGKKSVVSSIGKYGDNYILTDGHVVIVVDEAGAEAAKAYNPKTVDIPKAAVDLIEDTAKSKNIITDRPYVSHVGDVTEYIFDTPDGQIIVDKKYFDVIDGGILHYDKKANGGAGMIVSTDANGNILGAVWPIKGKDSRLDILDRANIKSLPKGKVISPAPVESTGKPEYTDTKETGATKEGVKNGERKAVEEVSDGAGVQQPAARGAGNGDVLDGMAPENDEAPAGGGDESRGVLRPEGERVRGHAARPDGTGDGRGRRVGDREGRDISSAGEVTPESSEAAKSPEEESTEHEIEVKSETALQEHPKGNNFMIPAAGLKLPSGEHARAKANIQAIKTLRTIMAEGRFATSEEQEILSKFVGWGGLANALDERKEDWAKEYKQIKELLTEQEFKTAKGSTLNAHYTEIGVIRGIYAGLERLGFTGGRLLEPSAGIGHFVGAMPEHLLPGVKSWTMVELDSITGNIAKYLYPNADVRVQGFEYANIPNDYMDMAISNVPFGDYGIADKSYPKEVTSSIHNYFFAKSLDKVRPGGLVVFITSRYTMDSKDSAVRRYIMKRADLLGAIRLPDTAFKGNAGTDVVTDILVLKKRAPNTPYKGEAFESTDYYYRSSGIYEATNEYFHNHPEMLLGEPSKTGSMYARASLTYTPKDTKTSLQKQIENAFANITGKMDYPVRETPEQVRKKARQAEGNGKNGSIVKRDGKLYKVQDGELTESGVSEKDAARMEAVIGIRDAARALLDAQLAGKGPHEIKILRDNLNALYDAFVKKNGPLHKQGNARLIKMDVDAPFILSLESYNKDTKTATKATIFTQDTVTPNVSVTHVNTVEEGLIVSMNETGGVDAARIAQLVGESEETVTRRLLDTGLAFLDRDGNLELAESYLSGNVKAKLRDAEALAEGNPAYKRNVEALKKVIPADVPAEEISVRPGVTWIPATTYGDFAAEMLGTSNLGYRPAVEVSYSPQTGQYSIKLNQSWLKTRPENTSEWGTPDRSFVQILTATLNNRSITVWRKMPDGSRVLDKQATAAAQEKQEKILAEFQKWIWKDEGRKAELQTLYNDIFNNSVTPHYDGSNLTVNGANAQKPLRPHQKDVVWRIVVSGGNTLIAHRVGAGKTYEMAAAAMKLRQLGIVRKPVFVVPKSLVAQWGNEFLDFFPAAKVLVLDEKAFTAQNRKEFANRIATGDWDAVIMSQEQFKAVPMSFESQEAFYQEQIDQLEIAILEAAERNGKRDPTVKQLEKAKKSLEVRLKKLADMKKDSDNIDFESLGVDSLFVDEAHSYKNLFYTTNMNNVSGLGNKNGSQKAFDLYMKTRYLQRLNGGKGIVFATATPVMNSMSEMYIMQRYLQGDLLDARGLTSFDAWANQFGEVRTVLEMNPSGKGFRQKQSFSRFKNLAELQQMFRSFADVLTDVPGLKIPTMKTGKRIIVESEPSEFQMQYIEQLAERADAIKGGRVDPHLDNMLKITSEGRKLSYTQRMIDPALPYEPGNKITKCVQNVYDLWKSTAKTKGTQLIFCDLSTPKGGATTETDGTEADTSEPEAEDISIYDDIKSMLVAQGIPASEIAFIHDADTNEKKAKLFEDVNEGKVRILIGSTGKMGVGMNAQKRVVALHHLDAPWRPGDIEQREGRALRQGNMNDEVAIYVYVTKKTFDSRMWDNLQRKASFINQVMAGDLTARESEGDGDFALSAAEIKAISSGNPLIMEQFEVAAELAKLETLERAHNKEVADAVTRIQKTRQQIASDEETEKKLQQDAAARTDTSGDNFTIQLGGKTVTDRKTAGETIVAEARKHLKIDRDEESVFRIGSFAGFDLYVTNGGDMLLRGAMQYRATVNMQSAPGTVQALEGMVKRIDTMLTATQKRIEEGKAAIKKLEQTAAAPFDRADELAATRRRNAEIMAELNPDEDTGAGFDEDEDEGTDLSQIDSQETAAPVSQEISSAGTSIKQVPALFKDKNVQFGPVNIDIGGGKYDLATDYLKERGTLSLVFDPYNRGEAQNTDTLNFLRGGYKADTATCANVLNVIAEQSARDNVILEMAKAIKPDGRAYFMVYEGNGSGVGKQTSAGWQNNRKTSSYVNEIKKYFETVTQKGKLIIAEHPKANLPKASWEVQPGKAVRYSRESGLSAHPEWWTAERVGNRDKKPMSTSEIIEKIRHDFGINITTGHIRGKGVRGQYNENTEGIRSRIKNDLPTVAHELGHHLVNVYDLLGSGLPADAKRELVDNLDPKFDAKYEKSELPGEGVAEFMRRFLQNRETAAIDYPEFTKYFLNALPGPVQAQIEQLADEVNAYYSLDADTAQSSIVRRSDKLPDARTPAEKVKQKAHNFYQAWVDTNHGIKLYDQATGADVYKLATNAAYADNVAANLITGDLYDINGAYVGPGLKSCFTGHEEYLTDKALYRTLGEYLVVKHGPERLAEGMRIFADDRKNSTAWMNNRQAQLEAEHPELEEISERLYEYQSQFLQTWGVDTGIISAESAKEWADRWQYYVPFNRAVGMDQRGIGAKKGFANQRNPYHKAVGSGLDIINPVDNIISNMILMANTAIRNNVMLQISTHAKEIGDATYLEQVPMPVAVKSFDMTGVKKGLMKKVDESPITDATDIYGIINDLPDILQQYGRGKAYGDIVTVLRDGKPEYWKINDPLLLQSISNMAPQKMKGILDAYAVVSRFMTGNITGNNLIWSIFSNAPRDLMTFFTYLKGSKNPVKAFAAIGSAYANKFKGDHADPLYKEFLAMGGNGGFSAYTADRDVASKAAERLAGKKFSANPLDWIAFASDLIEMGPRFACYKLMRNAGMNPKDAFYEAMDITVNFQKHGIYSREVNKIIPFFNAGVQGLDKFARTLTGADIPKTVPKEERDKTIRSRFMWWIAASAALAAVFHLLNYSTDKNKKNYEQLSNYTKNSYWVIPIGDGKYFAITKPRELGVLSSFLETCMEYARGNEYAFDEFYDYAVDTMLPNVASDIAKGDVYGAVGSLGMIGVVGYMMANRDFLGKPIVSAGMQYLEPKDQYNDRTSKIAYWIGQAFNVSPQMVDYFFTQTLGGWWKAQKALLPVGGENVDLTLGVQGQYIKDNQYSTDVVNRLYDLKSKSDSAYKSDPANMDKAITAKLDANMTTFYSRYLTLSKNGNGTSVRGTRQLVLDMILEFEKSRGDGAKTPAERAVYDIARKKGDVGTWLPSVMQNTITDGNNAKHVLTDVQYVEYQTDYNRRYWEIIEDSLGYANTDAERAAIIKGAKEVAKEQATNRMLTQMGKPVTNYSDKFSGVPDEYVAAYKGYLDIANDDGSLTQAEVIEAIRRLQSQGMSKRDANTLFHTKYSSDKNNPFAKK